LFIVVVTLLIAAPLSVTTRSARACLGAGAFTTLPTIGRLVNTLHCGRRGTEAGSAENSLIYNCFDSTDAAAAVIICRVTIVAAQKVGV
jgi:hypothetical protein